ncbi:MAG: ATP synthase F1 subunit gamma [Bryobacterales bacterium]|nr:ATP synthase F1 subunit gamma [Bryobacterales bacterium]
MPNLIDIRRRIRSVRNTQQITKAMKMVSAAKLRRAQERVVASRPYVKLLEQMLANIAAAAHGVEGEPDPLLAVRPEKKVLAITFSGEKGLCGAFNANIFKAVATFVQERHGVELRHEAVGRKARDYFRKRNITIEHDYAGLLTSVQHADAARIAEYAMDQFRSAEVDAVYLIYNEFRSVLSQKVVAKKLLPMELATGEDGPADYIYEQPPADLLGSLLPRYVDMEIYRAMLESAAAEHAARMTAMDAATSNAAEMIEKLTLFMNRVRQASITKEIIEVVSGATAGE